ncbi:hypothetical protein OAF34_06280 [Pirellulaceae bacterium]|nr:hypothetical protein [Pirellulaceae bacterium]
MTRKKEPYPVQYWAFRLGRLVERLSRIVESVYLVESHPHDKKGDSEDSAHVRDEFAVLDQALNDVENALDGLWGRGQSNLKQASIEAKEAFTELVDRLQEGLSNGEALKLSRQFSDLQEISWEFEGEPFGDWPINKFLASFRGEELSESIPKRGRGRPRKKPKMEGEIESPLTSESYRRFDNSVKKIVSRLGDSSALLNIGRNLERACQPWRVKATFEAHGKSWRETYRVIGQNVEKSLNHLAEEGVSTAALPWYALPESDLETRVNQTVDEVEERLKSFESNKQKNSFVITPLASLPDLRWEEVTIEVNSPGPTLQFGQLSVKFSARRVEVKRTLEEIGFLKRGGQAKKVVSTLTAFALNDGFIAWPKTGVAGTEVKKRKSLEDEENAGLEEASENKEEQEALEKHGLQKVVAQKSITPTIKIVTEKDVSDFRIILKSLLQLDDDPFYPYDNPFGESNRGYHAVAEKGYRLKCDCRLIASSE